MLTIEHKIKLLALLSIFVMVCGIIGISETVSAAKVKEKAFKVDQGTMYYYDKQEEAPAKILGKHTYITQVKIEKYSRVFM